MINRPHFKKSLQELEEIVANANGEDELRVIARELEHRNTKRAQNLMSSVRKKLSQDTTASLFNRVAAGSQNAVNDDRMLVSVETEDNEGAQNLDLEKLYDDIGLDTDDPVIARLASWITLEALSPQTYRRPEDLVSGDRGRIARLKDGLPWTRKESSRKNYKLYYEIILGAIDMDRAEERLIQLFGQDEEKQRRGQTKAAIASILVDTDGHVVDDGGISVSSFAWALPLCLAKRFDVLGSWPKVQENITPALENMLKRQDKEGNDLPLDKNAIWNAYKWLVEQFDIPGELITPPEFCLRIYHYYKAPNAPECSLLNSFFIEDLSEAIGKYQNGSIGEGLRQYLGKTAPSQTLDLLENDEALEEVLSPGNIPLARWPMGSARALVLLQQAAVNAASTELKDKGILSVNGPPGTGKTTLLRDIISHVVVERASAMCSFENPVDAFTATGEKVTTGASGFWQIYSLDPKIKGHEILVASSNNSAVENISHELPGLDSVAREEASYFRTVSDAVARVAQGRNDDGQEKTENPSWGLIAAALGNMDNRSKFQKAFWWDENAAMRLYLKAAKGDNVVKEIKDPQTDRIIERITPEVVVNEDVPSSPQVALSRWRSARSRFNQLRRDIEQDIEKIEEIRRLCIDLAREHQIQKALEEQTLKAGAILSGFMPPEHKFHTYWDKADKNFDIQLTGLLNDKTAYPFWLWRVLPFKSGRAWRSFVRSYRSYFEQKRKADKLAETIEEKRHLCGKNLINEAFFNHSHAEKQTATPWLSDVTHRKREDLFLAALDVHKAFIDASAQKMLHNLSVLMQTFSSGGFSDPKKQKYLGDLWSTLFLVVPVASTAFASVHRMLGNLPEESLGWLLIDEAGQAVPQAAVGAIMRAKRSVVVGDPIQIQPVVTLPQRLVVEVCNYFNVDPDVWAAPEASAQTLADQASKYQSAFETDMGPRLVGIPLLVHRRCEDPMFSISNEVAYNNFMVSQVRKTDGGPIRAALGPAQWFSVDGDAATKWCAEEGQTVIELFKKLQGAGVMSPDIFIITPFRIVAHEMRQMIMRESALFDTLGLDAGQFAKRCVGTVHTVQGREADTVILLLGAPKASQDGARRWAGSPENLLNVAVSRAKKNLYVVGSRGAWSGAGSFSVLSKKLT